MPFRFDSQRFAALRSASQRFAALRSASQRFAAASTLPKGVQTLIVNPRNGTISQNNIIGVFYIQNERSRTTRARTQPAQQARQKTARQKTAKKII